MPLTRLTLTLVDPRSTADAPIAIERGVPEMFCGTPAAHGGARQADRLEMELEDPRPGRGIRARDSVEQLPVLG